MSKNFNTDDKQHLDSVNRFLNTDVQWIPLQTSGSTNHHFKALVDGKNLILRLNAADTLAFGVSRKREASILELIKAYNWAPKIIHNNWQEGWCLMLDHGSVIDTELSPSELLNTLHQWQLIRPNKLLNRECVFNYQHLFEMYRNVFKATPSNSVSQDNLHLTNSVESKLNALPAVPYCLTHHDLHPGNLCKDGAQIVVLDWEYAGIGNPWFDAAALYSKFDILNEDIAALPMFKALNKAQFKKGMTVALELTILLEKLWVSVRK